ncbi:MAG: signal peptidase II [Syntrophomonadaceae bacterium]
MYYWIILALVILLDQSSKWWVSSTFFMGESRPVIDGILWLTYVHNQGAAFSILPGKTAFFVIASIIVITGVSIWVLRSRPPIRLAMILGLLSGGAAGNLVDRLRFSHVIDFLDLHWWPVFNFADMSIVVGSILLVWYVFMLERSEKLNG